MELEVEQRTIYPFGIDDVMQDQFRCPACKEWTNVDDSYDALSDQTYCWECGCDVDEELRSKWADKDE